MARILYIEDHFENRILVKRVLEFNGHTVLEAESGKDGIALAIREKPDLILMDINLPDVDGYEATGKLRQTEGVSQIPIIALTANAMEGDQEKALAAGCNGYIPKPVDIDVLPDVVAKYLKKPDTESDKGVDKKPVQEAGALLKAPNQPSDESNEKESNKGPEKEVGQESGTLFKTSDKKPDKTNEKG